MTIYNIRYDFSDIIFQSGLRRNLYEMLTELSIYKENKAYCNQSFGFKKKYRLIICIDFIILLYLI